MRLAGRVVSSVGILLILVSLVAGCSRGEDDDSDSTLGVTVEIAVTPDPPAVGPATVEVILTDEAGDPINGADLEIQGTMSHAGMEPVIVDATESQNGRYVSQGFEFSMGGDWIVTVRGTLPDGEQIEQTFDLKGVAS